MLAGCLWGATAVVVLLEMRRGALPAPGEAWLPFAIVLVAVYLPVVIGLWTETVIGRPAIGLNELVLASMVSGVVLIAVVVATSRAAWRVLRLRRSP